ncbi:hypothetical protein DRN69_05830 [Candidatus Pacearchaeota archaeon]|nr:MAG: hypothetical protein DRN69_05830 [Candidatus Pacearchaeota archaeon]
MIIIGDKNHAEIRGIIGQLKAKPLIIESKNNIPFNTIKKIKKLP